MIYTWRTLTPVIFDHLLSGRLTTYEFKSRNVTAFSRRFSRNGHIKTAEQRTIIQQYGDWYTGRWWVGCYIW